jgi:Domain of unknown function (DUF4062)
MDQEMLPRRPTIFLSSTYEDLHAIRGRVRHWLSGIYGAEMVVMETFGSESAPPDIASVRRVRGCDIFIGIYAFRYGTIDGATGKSITELELDEAESGYSVGAIRDILIYATDNHSGWLSEFRDSSTEASHGRKRLREKFSRHTYSTFASEIDLLFAINRDIYRIIARQFVSRGILEPLASLLLEKSTDLLAWSS